MELIKISEFPESSDPKDWIVVSDSTGTAYKLSKDNLKAFLGTVQAITPKPLAITDPTPTADGIYPPTDIGVYPNGLENKAGFDTQFILSDGVWYVVEKELPVAEASNIIVENGTDPASTGAVYDVKSLVVKDVVVGEIDVPIVSGGLSFGGQAGIYGWGFASEPIANIKGVVLPLSIDAGLGDSTQQRIVVRENNYLGAVLHDESFAKTIVQGAGKTTVRFNFSSIIDNSQLKNIWYEVYTNSRTGVFRISPAVKFTEANGYPFPKTSSTNDLGATQVSGGNTLSYYDVEHSIVIDEIVQQPSDLIESAIDEAIAGNSDIQKSVQTAKIVDALFYEGDFIQTGEFELFSTLDGIGAQGNTLYGIGFPIGVRDPFKEFSYRLYFLAGKVLPTTGTIEIREGSYTGALIGTATIALSISPTTGVTIVTFTFSEVISSEARLYAIIYTDGQSGAYRRTAPTSVFTQANGYLAYANSTVLGGTVQVSTFGDPYYDFWFKVDIWEEKINLTEEGKELLLGSSAQGSEILPNENEREVFAGDSVPFGDGYLQSRFVGERINYKQTKVATSILASEFSSGMTLSNRKYFSGQALRLEGVGQEIEFNVTGNEVSVIQSMDRSNINASEIEVYIDDVLHDTINNFNPSEIGTGNESFVGDGVAVMFDLGRPFTYGHSVTVNGASKVVTLNINQGANFVIPVGSDCAVIRRLGTDSNGNIAVTHWLWFKVAPLLSDNINITFNYGATLMYEKTTIGEDSSGANESPFGDGDVSFDPTAPSAISSGLDFRQTDERVVSTYRFLTDKTRTVRIRVKGLYEGSVGTPYFIFNFATNRFFHFMNAGIGGWTLWNLDNSLSQEYLRNYQRIVQFNPDRILISSSNNDDWLVKIYRLHTTMNVTLSELRTIKNLPLRSITYQAGTDSYDISKWVGLITGITEDSVTFDGVIDTPIVVGDVIRIGQYYTNNNDYVERKVSGIVGNVVSFIKPIGEDEIIYDSLQDFIGKEVVIRSLDPFKVKLEGLIDKIRSVTDCPIYVLENPMPNVLARELWGYPVIMDDVANSKTNVHSVDYMSLRKWQESQPKSTLVVSTATSNLDTVLNKRVINILTNGRNLIATDIKQDGVSIYGTKAVVENGWAYVVNQTNTGAALNRLSSATTSAGQVFNGQPPRVILLDDTLTGDITIEYAAELWSNDSTHMNDNSSKLYADFLKDAMK